MKKNLQTKFSTRQYMLSKDFELYYYNDTSLKKVSLHTHDYYEFYFFLEGNVSIQVEGKTYPVSYGDMIIIPPGISHKPIIHDASIPYRRFVFWISKAFYKHLTDLSSDYGYITKLVSSEQNYIFHHERITFNSIQSKILRLLEEMREERFGRGAQISLDVSDLLLHINRLIYERNHPSHYPEPETLYQKISHFIEEHIDEELSLERLSNEFFVSKYHISHIFKDNLGLSVHQYITKKRLALCHQALMGDATVIEVYRSFGFGDYSSFFRAFKKEYGISPSKLKKQG